jgi:hypothetical protein
MKDDELGVACEIYGVNEKYIQGFGDQPRRKETNWKMWCGQEDGRMNE